jgi:Flp pilus assembly protein TadD
MNRVPGSNDPRDRDALLRQGCIAGQRHEFAEAAALFANAAEIDPTCGVAYLNRAFALRELRDWTGALASIDRAIAIAPDCADAHFCRGDILKDLKHWEEALASFGRAFALAPRHVEALCNQGNSLRELQRWVEALEVYDRAIALKPDYATVHMNRATVLRELNRFEDALAGYDCAISLEPGYASAYVNRGILRLSRGQFEQGWSDYEWRWEDTAGSAFKERRQFREPRWRGQEDIAGKTLLLYGEQGYGDTLQFCRYVTLLAQMHARVILEVPSKLVTLLADLEGVSRIVARGSALPAFDCHCPLMSVPLALKTTLHTIPDAGKYLCGDAGKVAHWQEALRGRSLPKIGLAWSGNPLHVSDRHRSIGLGQLMQGLPRGFEYISLQSDVRATDAPTLASTPHLSDFGTALHDFSDTAALCECLDLVISVDTSIAHLSGALRKPTWVLLAATPDWRWLCDRSDSPWYPSVTLYRQDARRSWACVLERVAADLSRVFSTPGGAADRDCALHSTSGLHFDGAAQQERLV